MNILKSAAVVTTAETLAEARIAIASFKRVHSDVPVYLAFPQEMSPPDIDAHLVPLLAETPSTVEQRGPFHRRDAILMKMAAMRAALAEHSNCLLFDADMVFLAPVPVPDDPECDLQLSHNLSEMDDDMKVSAMVTGLFNAGLLWTSNKNFPDWWEHNYTHPKPNDFYEQGCLSRAHKEFRVGYFPPEHNYGWWRGPARKRKVHSFHAHLSDMLHMNSGMAQRTRTLRSEILLHAPLDILPLVRDAGNHTKRLFFVHFHKTAGVYCSRAFKELTREYGRLDSWSRPHNLERDWTSEELTTHLTSPPGEFCYLHQHHYNVKANDLVLAQEHGWATVMFYRDPREIICSLYHFLKKRGEVPPFEAFFDDILDRPELWALPRWHVLLDHCLPFSEKNLDAVCEKLFGAPHVRQDKINQSDNPGWRNFLTEAHVARLNRLPEFTRSMNWLTRNTEP